jgi:nonribosomal peptide synthetase DhbF
MSQNPQALALTDGDLELTYADLRQRAEVVAKTLVREKIAPGSVIGMHLPRSADAIAAMLGIMVSGCAYLPLDPAYPAARLRYMLDQADAAAVVAPGGDEEMYGPERIWLAPPSQLAEDSALADVPVPHSADKELFGPDDLAYVLFTSGSTGKPKGVMVTHANITVLRDWGVKSFGITQFDASATTCSLSFDPSFLEILLPLSVGATVHVIPHALALGQLTRPVSFIASTPTVVSELLRAGQLPELRHVSVGGESLAPDVAHRILSSGRVGTLLNTYGPTECTIAVSATEVLIPVPDVVPIGRQTPGTEILILDEDGKQLPDGETGEICLFGRQVARGYVNDPERTEQRFCYGPADAAEPRRYYRTGDLGYRTADGMLYFRGRADRQVKINGIRIELGEIDAALRSHAQVSDAATIVQQSERAVAYVVLAQPGGDVDFADLKNHVAQSLPPFMVPAGIVVVPELPTTVNGKLDTAALPEWIPGRQEEAAPAEDLDEVTARVIEIAADITGFKGQVKPSDDFMADLGGTSLGIVRVLVELEHYSGRRLRIGDALADTTVAGLVSLLLKEAASPVDFALNTEGDAAPLFIVHPYLGGMLSLKRAVEHLPLSQPVYGLHVYGDTSEPDSEITISTLADDALRRIREVQPTGPITVLGWSAGGLIAFEIARKLVEAGEPEPRLLLMDAALTNGAVGYYWGESLMHPDEIISNGSRILWNFAGRLLRPGKSADPGPRIPANAEDLLILNEKNLKAIAIAVKNFKGRPYRGSLTVMKTRQGRVMAFGRRHLGWRSATQGTVALIDVPGAHLDMLEPPHVDTLVRELTDWLARG